MEIGFATAKMMVREGVRVAIADVDAEERTWTRSGRRLRRANLIEDEGAQCIAVGTDITRPDQVSALAAQVAGELGPVDILVHSAAILDNKRFMDSRLPDWQAMIDVCLYGPLIVIHELLPGMIERGHGRVVCIGSDAGRVGQAHLSYYVAAKGGVIAQVKSIAQVIAPSRRSPSRRCGSAAQTSSDDDRP